MEQQLKQRLVGVAVIFSLAVIFLPMLLDGSGQRTKQVDVTIPPKPIVPSPIKLEEKVIELKREVAQLPDLEPLIVDESSSPPDQPEAKAEIIEAPEPKPVEEPKKVETVAPQKTIQKAVEVKKEASKKTPKKQIGGETWVIQVGSFSDKNKAYKQRDKIRKSKLSSVFIEQFKHQGKTRFRVRMGPFIKRDKANVVRNKVLAKYNIKGLVMRYEK